MKKSAHEELDKGLYQCFPQNPKDNVHQFLKQNLPKWAVKLLKTTLHVPKIELNDLSENKA